MATEKSSFKREELWPSIVSITIPLVQLISVVVVGLSNTLHIDKLLVFPEALNIINILTIILTISLIAWFWYWRSNINLILPSFDAEKKIYTPFQKVVEKLIKYFLFTSSASLAIFILLVVIIYLNFRTDLKALWGILQYLSYSAFLVFSGISIYIWIHELIQKKQTFQREDFIRNLLTTLSEHGLIPRPNLRIVRNQYDRASRIVEVEIDDKGFVLNVSLDGLEITKVQTKKEYKKIQQALEAKSKISKSLSSQEEKGNATT